MTMCESLEQQRALLAANLAAVDAAILQTTNPRQLQQLLGQQAQLRAQLVHVDSLLNQNCSGGRVAGAEREPLASAETLSSAARQAHVKALRSLTAASLSFSKAEMRAHRLPPAPGKKNSDSREKAAAKKANARKKENGKKER